MILITGAAGKTGLAVIRALARRGSPARAFVRRARQGAKVRAAGASECVVGDLNDEQAVTAACDGVSAIYHICPNVSPDEEAIGSLAIGAASAAGIRRFVFHSVLHPETEAMPHHWRKLRVEAMLVESGLSFTSLRPTAYMQNLLANQRSIRHQGELIVPYSVDAPISLVDLEDVAEVAATVLTGPGHAGATYDLCGTAPLPSTAVAETLAAAIGSPVRARRIAEADWREANPDLDTPRRDALLAMFRFYDRHGLPGNPNVLRWLLGREPTSLRSFAARALKPGAPATAHGSR